jgi:ATP-dependent Clp protease ATP-binding subunit ClpA
MSRPPRALGAYARASLERAEGLARRLHAAELSPEHWLVTLLGDESCAATRTVLHAFADPETLAAEVMALCEGIMVVGSGRTLPFSVRAVEALGLARSAALARGTTAVVPTDTLTAALACLTVEARSRLEPLLAPSVAQAARTEAALPREGAFFRSFGAEALRALAASARLAGQLGRTAIGPAHLLLGVLEASPAAREACGLTLGRARLALTGLDEDPTPLPERRAPPSAALRTLLEALPEAAQTSDVLAWLLAYGSPELTALLRRQKVTVALAERCRNVFRDPD